MANSNMGPTASTAGFIGQYLIRDYGKDYEFVVPVRDKSRLLKEETGAGIVESDYTVDSLKRILQGCDAVIHLAAKGMRLCYLWQYAALIGRLHKQKPSVHKVFP